MIKIAASLITIAGLGICGILKAARYKERTDTLSDFIQTVEKMKMELEYRRESLPELIARLADENTLSGCFFTRTSEIYRNGNGHSLKECWDQAADVHPPGNPVRYSSAVFHRLPVRNSETERNGEETDPEA